MLPKKRVLNTTANKKKEARESKLGKTLTQLERCVRLERKNIEIGFLKENIKELNEEIEHINQQHDIYIEKAQLQWSEELITDLKGWWQILRARRVCEIEKIKRKEIEKNIEKRCAKINGEQRKMLTSLLDKPYNKI